MRDAYGGSAAISYPNEAYFCKEMCIQRPSTVNARDRLATSERAAAANAHLAKINFGACRVDARVCGRMKERKTFRLHSIVHPSRSRILPTSPMSARRPKGENVSKRF
jgi:hypothetical protein